MIESPAYKIIEDIGRAAGRIEGRVEALLQLLEVRFGKVPAAVRSKISRIKNLERCDELLKHAVASSSIGEFKTAL